jgi:BirA family biotin operon repressor/biotin-[acetyl-CoA-carboxylase] ligase
VGRRVLVFDRVESTNTLALAHADDPANDGLAFLAGEQTAGRGQYGRAWTAPPGSSVLLSVLLFPRAELRRPALLTAWASVSVCETILQATGLQAHIKWPNDVLVRGKKVCGILIEQRNTGHADAALASVVGIGLNVTQTAAHFEQAGLPLATSLAALLERSLQTRVVAEALLRQLDDEDARLHQGGSQTLESAWKRRLGLLGKHVVAELQSGDKEGCLLDVTFEGLVLEAPSGEVISLAPELVRHLESR